MKEIPKYATNPQLRSRIREYKRLVTQDVLSESDTDKVRNYQSILSTLLFSAVKKEKYKLTSTIIPCRDDIPDGYKSLENLLNGAEKHKAANLLDIVISGKVGVVRSRINGAGFVYFDEGEVRKAQYELTITAKEKLRLELFDKTGEQRLQIQLSNDLIKAGYDINLEHVIYTGQRIDILAKKNGEIFLIECKGGSKSGHITSAIGQLICYKSAFQDGHMVAAFPEPPKQEYIDILEANNIKIIYKYGDLNC